LNSGDYAWESKCEALDAVREQLARDHPEIGVSAFINIALPEGESLEWQTSLKCGDRPLYGDTSGEQFHGGSSMCRGALPKLLQSLLRRKVAWSDADIRRMLEAVASHSVWRWMLSAPSVLRVAERYVSEHKMRPEIRDALSRIKTKHDHGVFSRAYDRRVVER